MRNLLEMIFEYQLLTAKQDHLEIALDDDERARLFGLGQLLAGESGDSDRGQRAMPRLPLPGTISFTLPGGFASGDVKNVSGKGLAIATPRPPAIGTRVILRVVDETAGCEYFFPCVVVWSRRSPMPGMGVQFDGVPTRSDYVRDEESGVWASTQIGEPRKDVQAA